MKHAKILIVDDEEELREIIGGALLNEGYTFETASDGVAALELFNASDFSAVISDYNMPKMDGAELAIRLKEIDPSLPILLMSGNIPHWKLKQFLKYHSVKMIDKPFDLSTLRNTLLELLEKKSEYRTLAARQSIRIPMNIPAKIIHGISEPGIIRNLSFHGALVESLFDISQEKSVTLEFQNLTIHGSVAWASEAYGNGSRELGVRFDRVDESTTSALQNLLISGLLV